MIGEHELLERLRRLVRTAPPWVALGIGDDAAVLEPDRGTLTAVSTDALIEDVHFRRSWMRPRAIGHKALAVALSDLAAMGAEPRASLLSLALPTGFPIEDFDELLEGFSELASESKAALVGGNIARSPGPLVLDVTVIGSVRRRRWLTRAGGRDGDELFVTGALGAAAAGLAMLDSNTNTSNLDERERECIGRYQRPEPRLRMGLAIARNRAASAAIDLSDGLADGARQLAAASKCGVVLEADRVPIHPGVRAWSERVAADPLAMALSGGEDYELLFVVNRRRRKSFEAAAKKGGKLPVARVGRLTSQAGAWLQRDGRLDPLPRGFSH